MARRSRTWICTSGGRPGKGFGSAWRVVLVLRRRRLHEAEQPPHLGDALAVRFVQRRLEPHIFRLWALTQRHDAPANSIRMFDHHWSADIAELDRAEQSDRPSQLAAQRRDRLRIEQ